MRTCVCNPAALKAAEELHARSKGLSTSVERQADFDRANPVAYAARTGAPYHDFDDED